jgi:hypothetical protein
MEKARRAWRRRPIRLQSRRRLEISALFAALRRSLLRPHGRTWDLQRHSPELPDAAFRFRQGSYYFFMASHHYSGFLPRTPRLKKSYV